MTFRTLLCAALIATSLGALTACAGKAPASPSLTQPNFPFSVGKTWSYMMTVQAANGGTVNGDAVLEFTNLDGNNASFKLTGHVPSAPDDVRSLNGDLSKNPYMDGEIIGDTMTQDVTVPAGTFSANYDVVRMGQTVNQIWYDTGHGLLKLVSTVHAEAGDTISTFELK
jgi:hypothetical protein